MNAYIFPGQGSQYVGMCRDAYLANAQVRDIIDRADNVLGYQLSGIMFEGPAEELTQTKNAQPAIFLHSFITYEMLENPMPSMAAGHSLGEYSALTIAGALNFDDALRLVQLRGNLMQEAGTIAPGTMAAIIGLEDSVVEDLCSAISNEGYIVQPANYNAPGQLVISGSVEGVTEGMKRAKEAGAKLVRQLNVSGAFHSRLMETAAAPLAEALSEIVIQPAEFPVYANASATPETDPERIRELLLKQLTAPVLWTSSVQRMASDGATSFIELGPGNVLQGLVKRIAPGATLTGADKYEQVEQLNANNQPNEG